MKRIDANHSNITIDIRLQKLANRLWRDIPATRNRNVRMPGAKLWLDPSGQSGFLHTLVHLEKMRMPGTDADPNDFRRTFGRKYADARDRQKKRPKLDCA